MKKKIELLNWIADLDFKHCKIKNETESYHMLSYHFYLEGSKERFTSKEILKIFNTTTNNKLFKRWVNAQDEYLNYLKQIKK